MYELLTFTETGRIHAVSEGPMVCTDKFKS